MFVYVRVCADICITHKRTYVCIYNHLHFDVIVWHHLGKSSQSMRRKFSPLAKWRSSKNIYLFARFVWMSVTFYIYICLLYVSVDFLRHLYVRQARKRVNVAYTLTRTAHIPHSANTFYMYVNIYFGWKLYIYLYSVRCRQHYFSEYNII